MLPSSHRILRIVVVILLFLGGSFGGWRGGGQAAIPWQSKIDAWVLDTAAQQGETEFIVYLAEQADLSAAYQLETKLEKGTYVYQTLTALAERTQGPVLAALEAMGAEYRAYWVANMIWVRGDANVAQAMAQRADVAYVYANPAIPVDVLPDQSLEPLAPEAVEWNIALVGADKVWAAGVTGEGVVIGGQDTGYDWDHPALINQYRGWDGSVADHNYNWWDAIHSGGGICGPDSPEPCDDNGHGTHTMGTMVGDDGGSNQIGMAPGAKWIGCRNMDQGNGTPDTYIECYQWFIAPTDLSGNNPDPAKAPHVINNSWSCPPGEGCNPDALLAVVQNVRAAGILTVHSAGNSGPGCNTVNTPAATYDESFSVGATTAADVISSFSSRGLSTFTGNRKPDITAPGSGVRSSDVGGGYRVLSGTSMAAPHVAGLAALLISANPALAGQVDALEEIIERTAVPLTTTQGCGGDGPADVPNNVYGWGRIDALAALRAAQPLTITKRASSDLVSPAQLLTYTLSVTRSWGISTTNNVVLTDVLPANTTFVTATLPHTFDGSTITWTRSTLNAWQTFSVTLVVRIETGAQGAISNAAYGVRSDELAAVGGKPVITTIHFRQVALAPDQAASAEPGERVTFTHSLTNTGTLSDTYDLTYTSGQGWRAAVSPPISLQPGESASVTLTLTVPLTASIGISDTLVLTATSRSDGSVSAAATNLVTVVKIWRLYFPFVPIE